MRKIKQGMLFIQSNSTAKECNVFICLNEHKFLKFVCENKDDIIIQNVRRLRLGLRNIPSWSICSNLPDDVLEGNTGPLSPLSLKEVLTNIDIGKI